MLIAPENTHKIFLAKWGLPNKLFADEMLDKRQNMNDSELIELFDSLWESTLKDVVMKSIPCQPEDALQELNEKQRKWFKHDQEHQELILENYRIKFIIQLCKLSNEKRQVTQIWYISYADKHPNTLWVNFDSVAERKKFKKLADSLNWNDEELGKQLILDFMAKFEKSPLFKNSK